MVQPRAPERSPRLTVATRRQAAREEARKLLLNNKRKDAAALLDRLFLAQFREADAFLNGLLQDK